MYGGHAPAWVRPPSSTWAEPPVSERDAWDDEPEGEEDPGGVPLDALVVQPDVPEQVSAPVAQPDVPGPVSATVLEPFDRRDYRSTNCSKYRGCKMIRSAVQCDICLNYSYVTTDRIQEIMSRCTCSIELRDSFGPDNPLRGTCIVCNRLNYSVDFYDWIDRHVAGRNVSCEEREPFPVKHYENEKKVWPICVWREHATERKGTFPYV